MSSTSSHKRKQDTVPTTTSNVQWKALQTAKKQKLALDKELIAYAAAGDISGVLRSLKGGADVNAQRGGALRKSAQAGHVAVVCLLIFHGANVNAKLDKIDDALTESARGGHLDLVVLIDRGAKVTTITLNAIVANRHTEVVRFLIDRDDVKMDHDTLEEAIVASATQCQLQTCLLLLDSCNVSNDVMNIALKGCASFRYRVITDEQQDRDVGEEQPNLVSQLLSRGASPSGKPLKYAVKGGDITTTKLLLDNGANAGDSLRHIDWEDQDHDEGNRLEMVRLLLDNDADVHADNEVALIKSVDNGHLEVVRLLVDKGADIRYEKDEALLRAVAIGHYELVRLLLDRGADVNAENDYGYALTQSTERRDIEVVRLLLDRGANVHVNDDEALQVAAVKGHYEVVRLLVERGANVRPRVLMKAVKSGHLNTTHLLISTGAWSPSLVKHDGVKLLFTYYGV